MYSKAKIQQRLEVAERQFRIRAERHTVSEVEGFEEHLHQHGKYLYDDSGRPNGTQNLTEFEEQWILNEQVLCMADAMYALTRYGYIKDEQNNIRRFVPRTPQKLILEIIADLESRDAAIEIILLKARQLGVSTLIILLVALRIIFGHGVNAVIGSADVTKTGLMANMLFLLYDYLPIWLRPEASRRVESDRGMLVFGKTASGVSFQHGAQMSGIARGTTPTVYLLSECGSYTDPVRQIEAALFKAVHASPNVFGVLEGTGEGDKGWWPDTWRHAKANWKYNRARLCPMFLPWFCGTDIYPTPTWLRMRPVPEHWVANFATREHVAKAELFVRSDTLLAKHLGKDYKMPRSQQWFWEVEHEQAKAKDIENIFLQEMAGDDQESLQHSSTSIFGHQVIAELETMREKQYETFAIVGQSIERDHEPPTEFIDYEKERIPVRYQNLREESFRWELVPLKFSPPLRETVPEDATGVLFIWHHPQPGVRYAIGMDTGGGLGQDSTAISVWALDQGDSPDVQVAEYASAYVSHTEAFAFIMALAAYYKKFMDYETTGWREPYITIEQLRAVGDIAQKEMKHMGYANFHVFSRYDGKNPAEDKRRSRRMGFYTNSWSRPMLTGQFVQWAKNHWIKINSPWLIEECKTFEQKVTTTGKTKMEHEDGSYDDRIFAAAMATFCPHDLDGMTHRSKKRIVESTVLPALDLRPYQPNTFSYKDLSQTETPTLQDILDETQLERYR